MLFSFFENFSLLFVAYAYKLVENKKSSKYTVLVKFLDTTEFFSLLFIFPAPCLHVSYCFFILSVTHVIVYSIYNQTSIPGIKIVILAVS